MELIISIFSFVGSLTLFLFGMKTMIELSKTKSSTKININRVGGKRRVFFLLSFSDLSHHRTCGSAYGGSLITMQSAVDSNEGGIAL